MNRATDGMMQATFPTLKLPLAWTALAGITMALSAALPTLAQDPRVRLITKNQLESDAHVVRNVTSREVQLTPLAEKGSIPVVTAMATDPSNTLLAVAGDDHAIRLVDVETGTTIETLKGHKDWIHALAFRASASSEVGPTLYSAGDDGLVLRWQPGLQAPEAVARFPFAIRSLSLSGEKQLLAIAGYYPQQQSIHPQQQSNHPQIILWDMQARIYKHALTCDCNDQRCVRFSPDGSKLLCGGRDGVITVWETDSGNRIEHYAAHQGRIFTASFSSDGQTITSVGEDRRLVQYDLAAAQSQPRPLELPAKLMSMCLINDSVVAVAGADNSIQLYDFEAGQIVADLRDHSGSVAVMCSVGNSLASGSFDTTVRIWDLTSIEAQRDAAHRPISYTPLDVDEKLRIR